MARNTLILFKVGLILQRLEPSEGHEPSEGFLSAVAQTFLSVQYTLYQSPEIA